MAEQSTNERPARADEQCTCGRPATVVYVTENFGEVPHCGQPHPATADEQRERFTLGLMADVFGVLDEHGYVKAEGAMGPSLGVLLTLVETYEGKRA